ncbi:MAG: hypothetical protein RLZZ130_1325 [Pseudomonadota bacterium]|jgi:hypothetical protein
MAESKLERRFWRFWLSGLLLLALMIAMDPAFSNEISPLGMRDHQTAGTALRVDAIQWAWQATGVLNLARFGMAIDLVYIAIYAFGAYCGGRLFSQSPKPVLRRLGWVIVATAIMGGAADAIETSCQFAQIMMLKGSDLFAGVAATAQPVKTIAFLVTFFGLLMALHIRRTTRRTG